MAQPQPVFTGDPRTDRALLTLTRLLLEIAASSDPPTEAPAMVLRAGDWGRPATGKEGRTHLRQEGRDRAARSEERP